MEISCLSQTKDLVILNSLLPLLKTPPTIVEVKSKKHQVYKKDRDFPIFPFIKVDESTFYFGLHAIVKYLFTGTPLLTGNILSQIESVFYLADSVYSSAAILVAKSHSIVISENLLSQSQHNLTIFLNKISKYQSEEGSLASAYVNAIINVVAHVGVNVSPLKTSEIKNGNGLVEEIIHFTLHTLSIPERYAMSPVPKKKMYFSTPIYYINGKPKIGYVFTTTLVESLTKWYKLREIPILYSAGIDEHGLNVQTTAQENGLRPLERYDQSSAILKEEFDSFDLHPDVFIRTSEPHHYKVATTLWKILAEKGYIYKGKYEGWYSRRDENFIPNKQIDEKEVDGKKIKINKDDGTELVWSSQDSYLFKLSAMREKLLEWLDNNPTCITPRCYWIQIKSIVLCELRDISVSRLKKTISWGVPVPGDEDHIMNAWIEALANFLTVAGWDGINQGIWPCDMLTVGKDIFKIHGIYFPSFLIAAEIPVYKRLLVHGARISIDVTSNPKKLKELWGLEPVKYLLLRGATLENDLDYSLVAMLDRYNFDLVNILGNLVMRIINPKINNEMVVPTFGEFLLIDTELIANVEALPGTVDHHVAFGRTKFALEAIWELLHDINKYLTDVAPWKIKDNKVRLDTVIYVLAECLRIVVLCIYPFLPQTASTILNALGTEPMEGDGTSKFKFGLLKPGTKVLVVPCLFTKKLKTAQNLGFYTIFFESNH